MAVEAAAGAAVGVMALGTTVGKGRMIGIVTAMSGIVGARRLLTEMDSVSGLLSMILRHAGAQRGACCILVVDHRRQGVLRWMSGDRLGTSSAVPNQTLGGGGLRCVGAVTGNAVFAFENVNAPFINEKVVSK